MLLGAPHKQASLKQQRDMLSGATSLWEWWKAQTPSPDDLVMQSVANDSGMPTVLCFPGQEDSSSLAPTLPGEVRKKNIKPWLKKNSPPFPI